MTGTSDLAAGCSASVPVEPQTSAIKSPASATQREREITISSLLQNVALKKAAQHSLQNSVPPTLQQQN
jgi:hypothetical protein